MQGGQKRKVVLCAAANDSDEEENVFEVKKPRRPPASSNAPPSPKASGAPARGSAPSEKTEKKEEKEFAWMDSDEDDDDEKKEDDGADKAAKSPSPVADDEETASIESLDAVESFGRMLMLAPSLQKWLAGGAMRPPDVLAACRAMERTKFFDGDILEELWRVLKKMLSRNELDYMQTSDVLLCLKTLNAYSKDVLSAVARCFAAKTTAIPAEMRNFWLDVFKGFGHTEEKAFLQLLEVPPVMPGHPSYKTIRCWHVQRDKCVLGEACSFSHDPRAPLSLADGGREEWWKTKAVVMTQDQKVMGFGSYGYSKLGEREK